MQTLFTDQYQWLWTLVLGGALFYPVRQLIWVMSVRRAQRRTGNEVDEARRQSLKNRAGVTSALLCFVFSAAYVNFLFQQGP
jgi:hypothetical protein